MHEIQPLIEYIIQTYNFEIYPCSIPRSRYQYLKRAFYLFILSKVSKKLFFFLRDKVSPIKYLEERPNRSIWLIRRDENNRISHEVEIRTVPVESSIYTTDLYGEFEPVLNGDNYKLKIYTSLSSVEDCTFPFNHKTSNECIDFHFSRFDDLKRDLRDKKLKQLVWV